MHATIPHPASGKGVVRQLPNLPPTARDPVDDAKEVLAELRSAGEPANVSAAELVRVLGDLVALTVKPKRRELPPWKRLPVEQARMFIDNLATLPRDSDIDCARQLGRLEVHTQRLLDVVDSEVSPW
jgi:hypothetical protein